MGVVSGECERCGMHCLDCQCNRSGSSLVNGLELEDIVRSHYADNGWKGKRVRVESVSMLAELARLRRMADALCTIAGTTRGARGVVFCQVCNGSGLGIGIECVKHTATCDVAIHLDLPREKGDGE